MDAADNLRLALIHSYLPKEMFGQSCFFCMRLDLLINPHLLEYYHDDSYKKNVGLVPTAESMGRVRGFIPICTDCAQRCPECGLPIRTKWVFRMAKQISSRAPHLNIVFGQGYCRHFHPVLNVQSYFKPQLRIPDVFLKSEKY